MNSQRNSSRVLMLGTLSVASFMLSNCRLPQNVTWNKIQERGLIPAINSANGSQMAQNERQSGLAPVKVDPVMTPKIVDSPFGELVPGRPGYVYSPHTNPKRIVDVRDFKPGEEVRCPITFKAFTVPDPNLPAKDAGQLAATEPKPEVDQLASLSPVPPTDIQVPSLTQPQEMPKRTAPREEAPKQTPPSTPPPAPEAAPMAKWVPERPGFVYSPFATKFQLVDVAGIAPGVEVRCPYTGKLFRVPPMDQPAPAPAPAPTTPPEKKTEPVKPQETPKAPENMPKTEPKTEPKPEPKKEPAPEPKPNAQNNENLPSATWQDKEKGLVQSPYGTANQLVDVTGKAPGSKVVCPFTGKTFVVPAK